MRAAVARLLELLYEPHHVAEGILNEYACQDWRMGRHGHDFLCHLEHQIVRIAEGESPSHGAAPSHAVLARAIDDDEVGAAPFLGARRKADACACAHDGLPFAQRCPQPSEHFFSCHIHAVRCSFPAVMSA